jgi:peptidoglycan/LPS O-acetylase OafA/YrhL
LFHTQSYLATIIPYPLNVPYNLLTYFPGVPIFFFISGFLITLSYSRNSNLRAYLIKRILRIYPALVTCFGISVLTVFSIGFLTTKTLGLKSFYLWAAAQLTFFQYYNPSFLRNYATGTLNGSLWTIPIELQFYFILPLLVFLIIKRSSRCRKNTVLIILFFCSFIIRHFIVLSFIPNQSMAKVISVSVIPYGYYFLLGVLTFINHDKIIPLVRNRLFLWTIIYLGFCLSVHSVSNYSIVILVQTVLLSLWVFSVAYSYTSLSSLLLRKNDLSYGMYLYHMPITNLMIYNNMTQHFKYLIITFMISLLMAFVSWRLVEKPFLSLKRKLL